jgi:HAD superfamily hydrolase (TIGR01509 family)
MHSDLPRGVVFDMDGLMLASEELWSDVDREVARQAGRRYDPSLKPLFMGCEKLESARRFRDAYSLAAPPEAIARKRMDLAYGFYRERVRLMPGLTGLVADLRDWGKPLAVATSADRVIVSIVKEQFDLFSAFGTIVCADDVRRGKPAPDLFLEAAGRLQIPPSSCLVLEDSPNGVSAALSAGMKVIGVPHPCVDPASMSAADLLVHGLSEITRGRIITLFQTGSPPGFREFRAV